MKPWITVGEAVSPDGTRLELVEHDGEYIIKADDLPLMLTRVHFSKVELARVVCEKLQPGARVMIGGLGLGYTLVFRRCRRRSLQLDPHLKQRSSSPPEPSRES